MNDTQVPRQTVYCCAGGGRFEETMVGKACGRQAWRSVSGAEVHAIRNLDLNDPNMGHIPPNMERLSRMEI